MQSLHDAGVGVVAMKVMAGGRGAEAVALREKLAAQGGLLAALKWTLRKPFVHATIPSTTDMAQLDENLKAMAEPWSPADEKKLVARLEQIRPDYCSMCGQCEGTCPKGLPVADVLRFLTLRRGLRAVRARPRALPRRCPPRSATCAAATARAARCAARMASRSRAGSAGRRSCSRTRRASHRRGGPGSPKRATEPASCRGASEGATPAADGERRLRQPRRERLRERQRVLAGGHVRDARHVGTLAEQDEAAQVRVLCGDRLVAEAPPRAWRRRSARAASRGSRPRPRRSPRERSARARRGTARRSPT